MTHWPPVLAEVDKQMKNKTLLLVGGTDDIVRKAKALGLRVLVLQHPQRITEAPCPSADVLRIVDYTDLAAVEAVARELHRSPGFAAAVSFNEPALEAAGHVNDLFGLGGTGLAVTRRMRDKRAMRRALAGTGLAPVGAAPLVRPGDIDSFADRYGYPLIVKPADGTASYGVFRLNGPRDAESVWQRVTALRGRRMEHATMPLAVGDFLIEQYVDGPEYSVECFSFAGRHVLIGITEKLTADEHFAELGHLLPARLDEHARTAVRAAVSGLLDAVGLRDGLSHTEVRLGPDGPAIIETHNRHGGDGIDRLVHGVYGIDLASYAVGWPFRLVPELPDRPVPARGACTVMLTAGPGQVESITGAGDLAAEPDVLAFQLWVKPGDTVRPLRDNWDRLAMVVVTGADAGAAYRRAGQLVRDTLSIQVREADGTVRPARIAVAEDAVVKEVTA
jgi:biotin carboxylase